MQEQNIMRILTKIEKNTDKIDNRKTSPLLNPKLSVPDAKIKQAISSVNEREKRKAEVQMNLINLDAEEQDKSYHFSDHNSIKLKDKNNESLEVSSKSEEFEKQGGYGLTERVTA